MDINVGSIGFHWRWNLSPKLIKTGNGPVQGAAPVSDSSPISLWFMVGILTYYSYGLSTNVHITGGAPPARHPVGSGGGSRIRIRIFVRRQWSPHAKNVWYTFICHIYEWNR